MPTSAPSLTASTQQFLDILLANQRHTWIVAGATLATLILAFYILRVIVLSRLAKLAERTTVKWDDALVEVLRRIRLWLILPALIYASTQALILPHILDQTIKVLAILGLGLQLLISAQRLVDVALEALVQRTRSEDAEHDATIASSIGVVRVVIVGLLGIIVVLFALDNLGVAVTPMLTGLGIGGIAVALAVQNILGDLFGSVIILLDRPFVVGDNIAVGDKTGTVERIGIKTTRIRSQSGEQIVFTNTDLLASRVQNFKRMHERRVAFTIGIVYETPPAVVRSIPALVQSAVEKQSPIRFDRCHFKSLSAYSLDFEVVYFVLSPDFKVHTEIQQAINLELLERFTTDGIEFAYPTQVAIQREGHTAVTAAPASR